jgi:hypothetical protein
LGEIFDGAFGAVRHNPAVMLGMSLLVILAATVLGVAVGQLLTQGASGLIGQALSDDDLTGMGLGSADAIAQMYTAMMGPGFAMLLAGPVLGGILTVSVSRSVLGDKASVRDVWQRVRPRVWRLIGWTFLNAVFMFAAVSVGILLVALLAWSLSQASTAAAVISGIVAGLAVVAALVWLGVRLLLVPPTLALENVGLWRCVSRGWKLSRGGFWRILGIYLLAAFVVSVISQIVSMPLSAVTLIPTVSGSVAGLLAVTVLTTIVSTTISTIFTASVVALLYIDARMRREGLDVALAAAAADRLKVNGVTTL